MERDLFRDRHPLLYHFIHHSAELAGLAFVLMVMLEIGLFVHLISAKIQRLGHEDCGIRSTRPSRR
jgi:hypothetical protein